MKEGACYLTQRMVVGAAVIVVSTFVASSWVGGDVGEDVVVLVGSDREGLGREREEVVKASGEVALEAAQGTFGGFAFGLFARKGIRGWRGRVGRG